LAHPCHDLGNDVADGQQAAFMRVSSDGGTTFGPSLHLRADGPINAETSLPGICTGRLPFRTPPRVFALIRLPAQGGQRIQWLLSTWKQATSYWLTEWGFFEFCGCSPA
jgi:hypothetical protein